MRFTIVFTLAAAVVSTSASLVARQSSTTVPACYYTCAAEVSTGNCSPTDAACLCKDTTFVSETTACIEKTCQGADLAAALQAGDTSCLAVGVTLTSSATASGTGAASSAGSASSTGTGTTPTSSASSSTSSSAPATTSSSAAATAHGVNAFIGFAAMGLLAIAL